jgi:hypothetical protein
MTNSAINFMPPVEGGLGFAPGTNGSGRNFSDLVRQAVQSYKKSATPQNSRRGANPDLTRKIVTLLAPAVFVGRPGRPIARRTKVA